MEKIKSLFKKDYSTRGALAYNEIVDGSEWVIAGDGVPTEKFDGTSCLIKDGILYKRYDRKVNASAAKRLKRGYELSLSDFKDAPDGWVEVNPPDFSTGHWMGWVLVDFDLPENKWHKEAFSSLVFPSSGTYELIGKSVQGNPYLLENNILVKHGATKFSQDFVPRDFFGLKLFFENNKMEGIVWHHQDGRMVKVKASDFGVRWPRQEAKND